MAPTPTRQLMNALNTWVPDYHFVLIVLNTMGFGGCGGGGRAHVTLGSGWDVIAHEFGHGLGNLPDEYCVAGAYNGGEPGPVNLTIDTNRATTKWGNFIAPSTPVPTGTGNCADYNQGVKPAIVGRQSRCRPLRGGGHAADRHLPPGRELPNARQRAAVLPRLLHVVQAAVRQLDRTSFP